MQQTQEAAPISLQVSLGLYKVAKSGGKNFAIAKVDNNCFILNTPDLPLQFFGTFYYLFADNTALMKRAYVKLLNELKTVQVCQPNEQMISEQPPSLSDRVVAGCKKGTVVVCRFGQETISKAYPKLMPANQYDNYGDVNSIALTADKNKAHISDSIGSMILFDVERGNVSRNFGQIHQGPIRSITMTSNSQSLFTSDEFGYLKQFSVPAKKLVKNYGQIENGYAHPGIFCIKTSPNNQLLMIGSYNGNLKQFNIHNQKITVDYGKIMEETIQCMEITADNHHAIIGDSWGNIKKVSMTDANAVQHFGQVGDEIHSLALTKDSSKLFVSSGLSFKCISPEDGQILKTFGVAEGGVINIILSANEKLLFATDLLMRLKLFNVRNYTFVKDHGKISDQYIWSLAN